MPITKMLSSSSIQQMQVESNRNASWMSERFWWPVYIGIIVALRLLAFFLPLSDNAQWTATNVVHGAVGALQPPLPARAVALFTPGADPPPVSPASRS